MRIKSTFRTSALFDGFVLDCFFETFQQFTNAMELEQKINILFSLNDQETISQNLASYTNKINHKKFRELNDSYKLVITIFSVPIAALMVLGVVIAWHYNRKNPPQLSGVSDVPNLEISRIENVFDLSGWHFVAEAQRNSRISPARLTSRYSMVRLSDTAHVFTQLIATTSNINPEVESPTHDFLRESTAELTTENMRTWYLKFNINKHPIGDLFALEYNVIYWNGFQGSAGDWVATPVLQPTNELVIRVILPAAKACKSVRTLAYPRLPRAKREPFYDKPNLTQTSTSISWRILTPRPNWTYRMEWDW